MRQGQINNRTGAVAQRIQRQGRRAPCKQVTWGNSHHHHHHHYHVACPCRSVAVSTISRHSLRPHALCRADHRPRFCCFRSFSIVYAATFVEDDREVVSIGSSISGVEGPLVVLIWIWTDYVAEESQTPGHDRLGDSSTDRRLNGAGANYLVGDA